MSSYVTSTLVNGEKIMCRAHYHWFWWAKQIITYVILIALGIAMDKLCDTGAAIGIIAILIAAIGLGYAYLRYTNDEIVITNHRVVLKTRILARDVFEMQIQKVETIQVDQSVLGRVFNYGKISCRGTGGTLSGKIEIADPLAFRAAFQNAIKEASDPNAAYEKVAAAAAAAASAVNSVAANANPAAPAAEGATLDNVKLDEIISLLKEISTKLDNK